MIAHSFAPQFFRHAIGHGLLIAEYEQAGSTASTGELVSVDFATGRFTNDTRRMSATAVVPQGPAYGILVCGGLLPYLQRELHGS